jgi:hypothetical protein
MISRADTVNLSNMPVVSEGPYPQGDTDEGRSLEKLISLFSLDESLDKWKVTSFETTPLVSCPISFMRVAQIHRHRCQAISLHSQMDTLNISRARTRAHCAGKLDLFVFMVI